MKYSIKEIQEKLTSAISLLKWSISSIANSVSTYKFNNAEAIRNIVDDLDDLGLFQNHLNKIKSSILYSIAGDSIKGDSGAITQLGNMLERFKEALEDLISAISSVIPSESSDSLNIKLPPVNDFADLASFSKDFHIALTQVLYIDEIGGNVKIESVENGSIWLNILVGGAEAVTVIASLAWSAAVIYKKVLEGKTVAAHVRSLNIKNESLEDLLKAQQASTALLIQAEAEHIQLEHFHENLPENVERIKNSLKLLSELIEKGAVIQPALMAPEDVKNLFPDTKNVTNLESKIKRLNS